jgi:hypothetical protein
VVWNETMNKQSHLSADKRYEATKTSYLSLPAGRHILGLAASNYSRLDFTRRVRAPSAFQLMVPYRVLDTIVARHSGCIFAVDEWMAELVVTYQMLHHDSSEDQLMIRYTSRLSLHHGSNLCGLQSYSSIFF